MRLSRLTAIVSALAVAGFVEAATAAGITVTPIATPAAPTGMAPSFTTAANGTVWLSWIEPGADAAPAHGSHNHPAPASTPANTIHVCSFDDDAATWGIPRAVVTSPSVAPNSFDVPLLAFDGSGQAHVVWTDGRGGAFHSTSRDEGKSWTAPSPWTTAGHELENFALTRLVDGRILAVWLDGRGRTAGGTTQQLYSRVLGETESADQRIDASVCDCCQTTLVPLLDGGAMVAYRGRTSDEARDILVARLRDAWTSPHFVNRDGWRIKACPVNGPRLAVDGSRMAACWFTAAGDDPQVLVSYSPDAGDRWLNPLRIDRGSPAGRVDVVLLRDGAILAVWVESDGSLWLRRISPDFTAGDPVQLAGPAAVHGVPRVVLLRDYHGDRTHAKLLVAHTGQPPATGIRSLLVTIPEGDLLAAERNCNCTPAAEELRGYPIRGRVTAVDPASGSVRVDHTDVPGVLARGTHDLRVSPLLLTQMEEKREFLGRVDRRDGSWWLLDARWLGAPVAPSPR